MIAYKCNTTVVCGSIPYDVVTPEHKVWRVALCDGRHPIPDATDGAIFQAELDPLDVAGMQSTAEQWIADHIHGQWVKHDYAQVLTVDGILHLYVTGLTVALVAVINAAAVRGVPLVLWHYDRASGGYYPQEVPCTISGNVDPIW